MKILFVHQYFSTREGTGGSRPFHLARALASRGHQVTVVCGKSKGSHSGLTSKFYFGVRSGQVDNLKVIEFNLRYANEKNILQRVIALGLFGFLSSVPATFGRYDLCFASSTPLSVALVALTAKVIRRKLVVFEVRDLWPELPVAMGILTNKLLIWASRKLATAAYTLSDQVICLAPGIAKHVQLVRDGARKVMLIPNFSDPDYFSPKVRREYNAKIHEPLIAVYAGAHGRANGLDFLIEVGIELEKPPYANVVIQLIGDGSEKKRLIERAQKLDLQTLEFRAPVPKSEMPEVLGKSHIGMQILEDIREFQEGTSPNKFFDYLASGLPVITNYNGWVSDLIGKYRCGWTSTSPAEFAEILRRVSSDRQALLEMSEASTRLGKEKFNKFSLISKVVDEIEWLGRRASME